MVADMYRLHHKINQALPPFSRVQGRPGYEARLLVQPKYTWKLLCTCNIWGQIKHGAFGHNGHQGTLMCMGYLDTVDTEELQGHPGHLSHQGTMCIGHLDTNRHKGTSYGVHSR